MYVNPWIYNGLTFDEKEIDNYEGFVYCITCPDGRKYIGKKTFWFLRKVPGKRKRKKSESDWKKYYGSSEVLKNLVKEQVPENFTRVILSLHKIKAEMNYIEVKEQFTRSVLETDEYINDNIQGKYFKSRIDSWRLKNEQEGNR
jgi:hypothetical protein